MIFYCAIFSGQSGAITNEFTTTKGDALTIAKAAAERPSTVAARVVKFNPQGQGQICELLNLASGVLTSHLEESKEDGDGGAYETVWKSTGARQRRAPAAAAETEDSIDGAEDLFQ